MKRFYKLIRLSFPYMPILIASVACMLVYTALNGISVFSVVPLADRIMSDTMIALPASVDRMDLPFEPEVKQLIDRMNAADKSRLLLNLGFFILFVFLFKGISLYIQEVTMEIVGQRIARDIRASLYQKYYRLPMTYFTRSRMGELLSRITNDVNLIHEVFSGRFVVNIKDSLQAVPFLITVFIIDWKLSLICTVVLPLLIVPIGAIGRKIKKLSRKTQEKVADISSVITETISGIRIVKIFCMEKYEQNRFFNELGKYMKIRVDFTRKESLYNPLTEIIGAIAVMFVLVVFPPKVMRGEITPGFFVTYLICLAAMIKPIRTIGKLNFAVQNAMAALDRIFSLLEAPDGIINEPGAAEFPGMQKSIVFSRVQFTYDKDKPVLHDITMQADIGKITAIVGPSGCGKTTLVNLIPRFFDPQSGHVQIDGRDIRQYSLDSLRDKIGMVTQETFLFNDTVARNIAYGHEEFSMDRIREIAGIAHAAEFIEHLPLKYDTVIGEKGARLSGGQKQRIAIARALLKNPPILILDEATSALDTESERIVQDAINKLMEGRTVIVIAHRMSTIMRADVIYVMDKGRITESGHHDELMQKSAQYKKLYQMQFV